MISTENPTAETDADSYIVTLCKAILSEDVLIPGLLNLIRDWVWTLLSYDLLNARLCQTDDSNFDADSQWFSQQLYSTLAMVAALIAMAAFYKIQKPKDSHDAVKPFPWAHGFIYLTAAAVSIYGWDRLQVAGITAGKNNGLSDNAAGYAAAGLTGFEGFIQYFTIVSLRTLTLSHYYTALKENPEKYIKQSLKGMACSLSFVALPGASWEVMFMLGTTNKWGAIKTSFAVALTVAFFNYVSVQMSIAFLKWASTSTAKNSESDHVVIDIAEAADPTLAITHATPLLQKKDIYGRFVSAKNLTPAIDYMPMASTESTETAPLTKMLSGIVKALSAKKLSTRTAETHAALFTNIDPAFGVLVAEESGTFSPV